MGIYVPKLQKPIDCCECQIGDLIKCTLWKDAHCVPPDKCPLIEVKTPHGSLKDADDMARRICEYENADTTSTGCAVGANYCRDIVNDAPALIESEEA